LTGVPLLTFTQCDVEEVQAILRRQAGELYAVLDACDEPRVPETVRELGTSRAVSLYRGWAEEAYWAIAPYLVLVDEPLLTWIVDNLWKDPWGVFAVAPTDLASLRRHFRRFLKVRDPDGNELYFRFYDPRVLLTFLETCTKAERDEFMGPIRLVYATARDGTLVKIERTE
jgi:hypothetical protein